MAKTHSSGRKPVKPEYSAEKNLENQMDAAGAFYKNDMSLQAIAKELSLNPIKVRKLLMLPRRMDGSAATMPRRSD